MISEINVKASMMPIAEVMFDVSESDVSLVMAVVVLARRL